MFGAIYWERPREIDLNVKRCRILRFSTPPPPPLIFSDVFLALFNLSFLDSEWDWVRIVSCWIMTATQHQPWPILANTVSTRANLVPRSHSNACLWTEYVAVYLLVIDTGSLVQKSNTYSDFTLSEVPKFVVANDHLFFSFSCHRTCQISLTRSKCKVLFV